MLYTTAPETIGAGGEYGGVCCTAVVGYAFLVLIVVTSPRVIIQDCHVLIFYVVQP